MSGPHFAWELFKLTLGVVLVLFAAIYTIVRFAASVLHVDAYSPALCCAESHLYDAVGEYWVSCDRPAGHDGLHHDDAFSVDWTDEPQWRPLTAAEVKEVLDREHCITVDRDGTSFWIGMDEGETGWYAWRTPADERAKADRAFSSEVDSSGLFDDPDYSDLAREIALWLETAVPAGVRS